MQFLYQYDTRAQTYTDEDNLGQEIELFWEATGGHLEADVKEFSRTLILGTCENTRGIDSLINRFSEHWRIPRMPKIDRNVLRLAIYELVYLRSIPPPVTINEAVGLAKKYSTEESGSFINGILDRVRIALLKGEIEHGYDKGTNIEGS